MSRINFSVVVGGPLEYVGPSGFILIELPFQNIRDFSLYHFFLLSFLIAMIEDILLNYLPVLKGPAAADLLELEYGQQRFQAKVIQDKGKFPFRNKVVITHFSRFLRCAVQVIDQAANVEQGHFPRGRTSFADLRCMHICQEICLQGSHIFF